MIARHTPDAGFSLVEVLVAVVILAIGLMASAPMLVLAVQHTAAARSETSASSLAQQKLEQLRALTWGFDRAADHQPISDTVTDLSTTPHAAGGRGLAASPADALEINTSGWVDYLDARGRYVGTGTSPPAGAVYIRRWRVTPLPVDPDNTLVLQVRVIAASHARASAHGHAPHLSIDDVLITSLKTRKED